MKEKMKTIINHTEKHIYLQPQIECVKLDNEISQILQSEPPSGPNQVSRTTPVNYNNNPFKTDIG
jgi:hypothetical protein